MDVVKTRKRSLDAAAGELASLAQAHLTNLTPAERTKRLAAFRRVVTNAGAARSKREERRDTRANRDLSPVREAL